MENTIVGMVMFLYAAATSYLQERFGSYDKLKPNVKKIINLVINLVIPAIVAFVQPYWKAEFGSAEEFFTSLLLMLSPFVVWLFSQLAHQIDKKLGL